MIRLDALGDYFLVLSALFGAALASLWLSIIFWTNRDSRARTRNRMSTLLATILVAVLNLPGLLIYLILRPRQTLVEVYQQTLEEEALLREIEVRSNCPGCGSQTDPEWQLCPHCHTRLRKACPNCGRLMDLPWHICPFCGHEVSRPKRIDVAPNVTADERSSEEVHDPGT